MPIEEKRTLKPIPSPSGCGNSEKSRAPAGAQPQAGGYRYGRWVGLDHQSKATQNKSSPGLSVERAYFKIRPGRTTCAYGPDTYRENPLAGVCEPSGECAVRQRIFVPRGQAHRSASCGRYSEACLAAEPSRCLRQKQARRSRGSRPNMQAGRVPRRIFGQRQPGAALRFLQAGTVPRCKNRLSARENAAGEGISVLRMQAEMGSPWSILTGGCRSGRCSPR